MSGTPPPRTTDRAADRLLLAAGRRSAARTAALFLVSGASAGATLAFPAALGRTLDTLLSDDPGAAAPWTALCALLSVALMLLDAADTVLTGTLNSRTTAGLRTRLVDHVLALGPSRAARFTPGDLVARCTGNAAHAGTGPAAAASGLAALATPLGGLAALALIDLRLAAVFLLGMPVLALLLRSFSRTSSDCVARYQEAQARLAGRLVEALGGARTIAAGGIRERERDRVLGPLTELGAEGRRMWRVQGRATAQAAVLVPLLQVAVVAVGGLLLAAGEASVGALVAAARYAALAAGVGVLVGQLSALVRSRGAAARLAEVHAEPAVVHGDERLPEPESGLGAELGTGPEAELEPGPETDPVPEPPYGVGAGRLELRGVSASRGGSPVLRCVDLTVPGGATVAVVGRSGAGKSLLAAVAGRLADPDAGRVLLDGVPLDRLRRTDLREAVAYAFERPFLLGGSVGGAITFGAEGVDGAEGAESTEGAEGVRNEAGAEPGDAVVAAARAACADDFIRTLPRGYATPCDEAPLSGGEAQRLGLARAFHRAFAPGGRLLILDDATSSLDTVTELRVAQALLESPARDGRPRTRLLVAHRASTASRADLVAWLDEGRIRGFAPHARLWHDPAYRALFGAEDEAGDGGAPHSTSSTTPDPTGPRHD